MTQYTGVDPYAHQVCTDKKRTMQSWISAASTGHMFRATPRNPKAKIEIHEVYHIPPMDYQPAIPIGNAGQSQVNFDLG